MTAVPRTDPDALRVYRWTWQGCRVCAALLAGAAMYGVLRFSFGELGLVGGIVVGFSAASAWHETKWKEGD